jgi:uncharacterized protein
MNSAEELSETKDKIEITAPALSDFFIDPLTKTEKSNAPFYYEMQKGDFAVSVKVKPQFVASYDAGGLFVYDSMKKWIKLEFEKTDLGYPSVVSVITDGTSDDGNGENLEDHDSIYLQIVRKGDCWGLHYSIDGKKWKMVRYFSLKMKNEVRVGLEAQSPIGYGCRVEFTRFQISEKEIKDIRSGR